MEKREILEKILNHGFQITPKALDMICSEEETDKLIYYLKTLIEAPPVVNEEIVSKILGSRLKVTKERPKPPNKKKITVADTINYNTKRYEILKKILSKSVLESPISINKITNKKTKFPLIAMIGMVNEDKKTILVDDTTDNLELHMGGSTFGGLLEGDVLFFNCKKNGEIIRIVDMRWPDIPLKKVIKRTSKEIKCVFFGVGGPLASSIQHKLTTSLNELDGELYLFVFDNSLTDANLKTISKFVHGLSNEGIKKTVLITRHKSNFPSDATYVVPPAVININGVTILVGGPEMEKYRPIFKDDTSESVMLRMLKRRDLNPAFSSDWFGDGSEYIIEDVPDIFVSSFVGTPGSMNYKGTTLISTGDCGRDCVCWVANLKSRIINKLYVV